MTSHVTWSHIALYVAVAACALALCAADFPEDLQEVPRKRIFCNPIGCMTNKRGDSAGTPTVRHGGFYGLLSGSGAGKRSSLPALLAPIIASERLRQYHALLAAQQPSGLTYAQQESAPTSQDLIQLLMAAARNRRSAA